MVTAEGPRKSPRDPSFSQRSPNPISGNVRNGENGNNIFSPRFKSIAAMAGWDEETLLIASLIVDDTPDRAFKQRKRSDLTFKTPPSHSRRKRRDQRRSPAPVLATVLNLDEEEPQETSGKASDSIKKQETENKDEEIKTEGNKLPASGSAETMPAAASLPCLDRLREELSCAICLEICYEPSTTACGHSFCKKCLRSAAEKCGKRCPKCRQLISSGRSCTVNTVLWNTVQLLFPKEIESRKASSRSCSESDSEAIEPDRQDQRDTRTTRQSTRRRTQPSATFSSGEDDMELLRRRRAPPSQDEDAALALRLQREEFMEVVRRGERGGGMRRRSGHDRDRNRVCDGDNTRISLSLARENLRAMASRAISLRVRSRP